MSQETLSDDKNPEEIRAIIEARQVLKDYQKKRLKYLPLNLARRFSPRSLFRTSAGLWLIMTASVGVAAFLTGKSTGNITRVLDEKNCESSQVFVNTVNYTQRQGNYAQAAEFARTFLVDSTFCEPHKKVLATSVYNNTLEAAFAQTLKPNDFISQQNTLDSFQKARALLIKYNIQNEYEPLSRLQILKRAEQSNQLILARSIASETIRANELDPLNQSHTRLIYRIWLRLGENLVITNSTNRQTKNNLGGLLASADQLERTYSLNDPHAREALAKYFGKDTSKWPTPTEPMPNKPAAPQIVSTP